MTELIKDIKLDYVTYKRLTDLKIANNFRNYSEVIKYLLDVYEGKRSDNVLCIDFAETKASLVGWSKLLVKKEY
jgi:hypothetical protein